MRFAPVLPPELYTDLDRGRYHLVQAHLIVHNQRMLALCDQWRRIGHMVILDNGAAELGEADIHALTRVAKIIRPSIIISPDVFCDGDKTLKNFMVYDDSLSRLAKNVMIVPHGNSVTNALANLRTMVQHWLFHGECISRLYVGVPKVMDRVENGRLTFIREAICNVGIPYWQIHLLGINAGLHELDPILKEFPNLMGVDSTLPCAAGLHASHLGRDTGKFVLRSSDWELTTSDVNSLQWQYIQKNIEFCRSYVHDCKS